MIKIKSSISYLKINSQAVKSQREEKSFQLKNRTRRQYNPDDTNIAKLFLMIREHKIGSPELDKTNAIKELLTQVQNINDIDLNDGGNTPLNVAVSKEHQDIVELLLNTSGIDVNIQNNQGDTPLHIAVSKDNEELVRLLLSKKAEVNIENKGKKTPLDIAKQSNKEKIIEILEEHLKQSSNQVERLSEQEKEVHKKLRKFVEDFVLIYESSLSEYYERLESRKGKPGKWVDFANKVMDIVKSGTEGTEETGKKAASLIGINVLQGAISSIGSSYNRAELKKLIDQLYIFKKDPIKIRKELVKSGVEIFQNFESQFVQVTADGSWDRAMTKLAEDAVGRVVNYYRKNIEKEFCASSITEGIVFGESKRYRQTSTGSPRIKSGHTLEGKNSNSWNTAELFDKAGLVTIKSDGNADKYYQRKGEKSNTSKYGYRLLFEWENINEDYDQEISPIEEYRYVLKPGKKGNLVKDILEAISKKGKNLIEARQVENSEEIIEAIKQSAEEAFNELEDYVGRNFNELSSYMESNQNEIKRAFDELMSQHQEASQQRHKIADSIKEGREENKEGFKQAGQKLDKIHSIIVAGQENKQVRESIWFDVKKPVRLFTGRKEELLDLHNKIQRSSKKVTVISKMTSISGLGGIGKTELARRYIQEYSKDYYNDIIWINAESEVTLIESFTRLAKDKLRIDTKDESGKEKNIKSIVEEVYKFFSNSKSLFIFDNVEKNNNLNEFLPLCDLLPGGNGPYVLITSCNREWEKGIEVINLNELKSEEAIEFVKRGLGIEDESQNKEIKVLVEKLQHFPLAMQQAIAYIEDQRVTREFDIDDYLEEYEKKTKDLLDHEAFKGIDNGYAKTTFTTWKITTDRIESNKEYGKLALRILNIISYLAPDKISREVFLGLTGSSEEELRSAVRLLVKYSMVNGEQKQSVLSTHKLVQEVTRIVLEEEGKSEEVMKETFKLLRASFPYGGNRLEDYAKKRELLPHLEVFLSHIDNWLKKKPKYRQKEDYLESLLIWMSDGYFNLGNPKRQKELLERALPIIEKHYGEEHSSVAQVLVNISIAYVALGDYQRAKELLERALPIIEKHYGEDHFEVARALVNLSIACGALGDTQRVEELIERALPVLEKHYGRDHFEVAKTLVNLGNAYRALGNNQRAKELLERALPIIENHYGEDHFEVARALASLSVSYVALGDAQRAKELLERALPILENHYGKEHFEVAKTLVNLSITYGALDDYQKQAEFLERVLPILENHYGAEYFEVGMILENLGTACLALGDYQEAKELLEKALPIIEKHYGEDHFEVAKTLVNLSISYGALGDYQKQKELLERALPILENYYGAEHFEVAIALENLGIAEKALGNCQRVKELQERASAIYQGGKVSIEKCLSKREVEGKCLFKWGDIDEFNIEKNKERDLSKIKIDSKKFIDYIKDLPEEKRNQLIELADKVQVTGEFRDLVNKLTSNQKVMNHLNRVKKISSIAIYGMMAKNILADFFNGDYQGVAVNIGFIAGGQGFAKVAEVASLKGLNLLSEVLGKSLRVASPFLARGTSAFIIYDLVNQVKAFKNGTEGALVGVVGDSIYLGVDAAEVGIEIAEAFEVLEGVSSVTGPVGATIGAVVFVGTDVYMAVKRVDKIDQLVHLTETEKFIEGLRAFIGMQPEEYVRELIAEKQLYNQLVEQGLEYLKKHSDIQSYVFPTGRSVVNSCRKVLYPVHQCDNAKSKIICLRTSTLYYTEECTTKFEIDLNSTVLLDRKRTDIKWSRARPDGPSGGKLFCLPKGDDEPAPSYGSYLCKNAIGLSNNKTEGYTLINLGEGKDYARGFKHSPNIFVVNNGFKRYYGGSKNDIFILQGDLIKGSLYGEGGIDTLDLTEFIRDAISVDVHLHVAIGRILYKYHGYHGFRINSVERVLGRKARADSIFSKCNTQFLDGNGGEEGQLDYVQVENNDCVYDLQVVVRNYTEVDNMALKGNFSYIVPFQKGSASVKLLANLESNHRFIFDYLLADIQRVDIEGQNSMRFEFLPRVANGNFNVSILYNVINNITYQLKDGTEIKVSRERNLYAIQSTNKTIDEIIESYPAIANKLNMTIAVQSDNESILVGHGKCEVLHNNPIHNSHLIGNGGKNIYVITIASGEQRYKHSIFSIPQVSIYSLDKGSSINTLDLRNVVKIIQDDLKVHISLPRISQDGNDLLVKLEAENMEQNFSAVEVLTVRLKDGLNWYEKLHIISDNVLMKISSELELKPLPLMFNKDKEIIVVTNQDVEKGTELITPRKGGNYTFVRSNGNDLMITNAFDSTITKDDLCSITLSRFYEVPKMKTLSIKFADKEIVLKDNEEEISAARNVDIVKREYKDQVYDDIFNRSTEVMVSDQPHRHRHRHQVRHRRSTNSSTRPSSWINDLVSWIKNSMGGLFNSRTIESDISRAQDLPKISQVDTQINVDGTIMLLDLLIRKVTGRRFVPSVDQSISLLEAQSYALGITEKFETLLTRTARSYGIQDNNLNFNPVTVQLAIVGQIRNGNFFEISKILYSFAKEACPEFKQIGKFLTQLKSHLEDALVEKLLLNKQKAKYSKALTSTPRKAMAIEKPKTFLNGTSIAKGIGNILGV